MKTKFLLIGAIAFTAIILSGCFWQEEKEDEKTDQKQEEINADSILDNRLFNEAITVLSPKPCEEVKASSKKEECKASVESLALMELAVQKKDKTVCKQIALPRYAAVCESGVNQAIADADKEKTALAEEQKQQKLAEEIFKSKDIEKCKQLQDNYRMACEENIINALAVEKSDKTICEKHSEKAKIEQCKALVKANQ